MCFLLVRSPALPRGVHRVPAGAPAAVHLPGRRGRAAPGGGREGGLILRRYFQISCLTRNVRIIVIIVRILVQRFSVVKCWLSLLKLGNFAIGSKG